MQNCDTLIHAGIIITQNEKREVLNNGSIAIKDGIIADIGPTARISRQWHGDLTLEQGDMLLMPGLINAHTHAAMTFLRGLADDLPLMEWLENHIFPVESKLRKEIVRLGSLLGYAEMLASGTTACIDMYIFEEAAFEAAKVAGLRCMGGEAIFAFPSAACPDWHHALEITRDLAFEYAENDRLKVAVNAHSVYTTTGEILRACGDLAREMDLPLHIHLAETRDETERSKERWGMRPISWCANNGLFENKVIAAHLVDITPAEISFLANAGAIAVHNPSSNMKLASGVAPITQMIGQELVVALGTDGPASNNSLNMFAEMGRAALLHKLAENDPTALAAGQVLDMATLGGARAFGDPGLGSLEVGKKADCVALDLNMPNLQPLHNPISQAVYAASGHECRMTMVGGEILFQNGQFTRFDYDALLHDVKGLRDFVKSA